MIIPVEKYKVFFCLLTLEFLVVVFLFFTGRSQQEEYFLHTVGKARELVQKLELTDFTLWTEARYTRHVSQADLFSAFQLSPSAPDHFPAGSIIASPYIRQN